MFQRSFHCCVGHGFTNRHHPEKGASRAPSCRQRSGLWWQVYCIGIRWQNYKGEVFQRLFICSSGVFNNKEQWPDREGGPWQLLHRFSFRSSVALAAYLQHWLLVSPLLSLRSLFTERAVWQIRSRYRCSWKGLFSVFLFQLHHFHNLLQHQSFAQLSEGCMRAKAKVSEWIGVT